MSEFIYIWRQAQECADKLYAPKNEKWLRFDEWTASECNHAHVPTVLIKLVRHLVGLLNCPLTSVLNLSGKMEIRQTFHIQDIVSVSDHRFRVDVGDLGPMVRESLLMVAAELDDGYDLHFENGKLNKRFARRLQCKTDIEHTITTKRELKIPNGASIPKRAVDVSSVAHHHLYVLSSEGDEEPLSCIPCGMIVL